MTLSSFLPAGLSIPAGLLTEVKKAYARPVRNYHHFGHVLEVLRHYKAVEEDIGWKSPVDVFLAVLYHDIIYDFGAKDNEAQSAVFARKHLQKWLLDTPFQIDYIQHLIDLTAQHGQLSRHTLSREETLFVDCDMAILGASQERFAQYEKEIEAEYTQVYFKPMYRFGRRRFFSKLLKTDRIFLSDYFFERLEEKARHNIAQALV